MPCSACARRKRMQRQDPEGWRDMKMGETACDEHREGGIMDGVLERAEAIEECMQCDWAFDLGGEKHAWVPDYGPLMGQPVAVCGPCLHTTTIGTLISPEHRATNYTTNMILAALSARSGEGE